MESFSTYITLASNSSNLLWINEQLAEKVAQFENSVKSAFLLNNHFVDQFLQPDELNFDALMASNLVKLLERSLGTIFGAFSFQIEQIISTLKLSSDLTPDFQHRLKLFLNTISTLIRAIRNLSTQASLREIFGKFTFLAALFNGNLDLVKLHLSLKDTRLIPDKTTVSDLARAVLQLASNIGVGKVATAEAVWPLVFPQWVMYAGTPYRMPQLKS